MLAYLEKFNKLPAAVRSQVSDARALAIIEALEEKYKVALAVLIMKVMVGELALNNLVEDLLKENLPKDQAGELAKELTEKIFSSFPSTGAIKLVSPVKSVLEPPLSEPKVKGSSFFFSPDDEEEIRQLTKKIVMAENFSQTPVAVDDKLKEIISLVKINFGSADLADRFSQILRTYLRGIRNKLDIKAALMKPFLSGGLSFDEASAQKVMLLADKVLNSVPGQPIKPLPKIKSSELARSDFSSRHEILREAAYDFKKLATNRELAPLTPAVRPAPAVIPATVTKKNAFKPQAKIPVAPIQPATKSDQGAMPLIKRRFKAENLSQSQKVKIEDVKYVPKIMGPLDELKYLDLINFRRLDRDPLKSADKIKNKINLLAEENYGKKLEGIKLWRLSPINKLYLEIGHLSISANKPVDVIIEERKLNNQEYLTAEEFKEIMDLNKGLRF